MISDSDLDGYARDDPKRMILERRMLGGDRLGGRGEERASDSGQTARAVLIDVGQEALASSAEPVPLNVCGRGNTYGAFCTKPRGHSGRHQF